MLVSLLNKVNDPESCNDSIWMAMTFWESVEHEMYLLFHSHGLHVDSHSVTKSAMFVSLNMVDKISASESMPHSIPLDMYMNKHIHVKSKDFDSITECTFKRSVFKGTFTKTNIHYFATQTWTCNNNGGDDDRTLIYYDSNVSVANKNNDVDMYSCNDGPGYK